MATVGGGLFDHVRQRITQREGHVGTARYVVQGGARRRAAR